MSLPVFRTDFAVHILWPVPKLAEDHLPASAGDGIRRRHHLPLQSSQRRVLEKILRHVVLSGRSWVPEKGRQKGRSPFGITASSYF